MPLVSSGRIVGHRLLAWVILAATLAASPVSAQEPIRLAAERISVAPEFEPERRPYGYADGDELPLATFSVGGGETWVGCVAYSPDGLSLAVGDRPTRPICTFGAAPPVNENGGLIRIINLATRKVTWTIRPAKKPRHEYEIVGLACTPDGKTLVAHGKESWPNEDGDREYGYHLTTWDLGTGRIVRRIDSTKLDDWELPTFSSDASTFAAKTKGGIRAWDVATGRQKPSPTDALVEPTVLALSADGKTIAAGNESGEVGLWEMASGRRIADFPAHRKHGIPFEINSLEFSPDGRTLASLGQHSMKVDEFHYKFEYEMRLLDPVTGRERATIPCADRGELRGMAFSPDGKTLAVTSIDGDKTIPDGVLKLWDVATGKERATVTRTERASRIAYSRDGSTLATADRTWITLRDPVDGRERFLLNQGGYSAFEEQVALSPDGRTLASTNGKFQLWDLRAAAEPPIHGGHRFKVTCLAYSPDGRTLASASVDRTVKLWDVEMRRPRATLLGHADEIVRLAYAPDGRRLASVDVRGSIRIWDSTTGACRATLQCPENMPQWLAFSPDGRALILFAGRYGKPVEARRWDADSGDPLPTGDLAKKLSQPFGFSTDNRLIVSANEEKIDVRDAATETPRSMFSAANQSITLFLSRDGETVIQMTQSHSLVVHRRSAGTWQSRSLFADDDLGIESGTDVPGLQMTATSDARILAAKLGTTVQVFDTARVKPLAEFPDPDGEVTWLDLSPDGKALALGQSDGEIVIHDLGKVVAPALKP